MSSNNYYIVKPSSQRQVLQTGGLNGAYNNRWQCLNCTFDMRFTVQAEQWPPAWPVQASCEL